MLGVLIVMTLLMTTSVIASGVAFQFVPVDSPMDMYPPRSRAALSNCVAVIQQFEINLAAEEKRNPQLARILTKQSRPVIKRVAISSWTGDGTTLQPDWNLMWGFSEDHPALKERSNGLEEAPILVGIVYRDEEDKHYDAKGLSDFERVEMPAAFTNHLFGFFKLNIQDSADRETVRRLIQSAFSTLKDDKKP